MVCKKRASTVTGALLITTATLCSSVVHAADSTKAYVQVYNHNILQNGEQATQDLNLSTTSTAPGLNAYGAAHALVDLPNKLMRFSVSTNINSFRCSFSPCDPTPGTVVSGSMDTDLQVLSPSAGNDLIRLTFAPTTYDGKVLGSNSSGFWPDIQVYAAVTGTALQTNTVGYGMYPSHGITVASNGTTPITFQTPAFTLDAPNSSTVHLNWAAYMEPIMRWDQATPMPHGSLAADFEHTASWGGILSAYDVTKHVALNDVKLMSASGVNWMTPTAAVPEPQTWSFLLAGIAVLVPALKRRRITPADDQ